MKGENHIIIQIRNKLESNMARISKADKGNSIVIIYNKEYNDKIQNYIRNNNFTLLNKNPTAMFQNKIKTTLNYTLLYIKKIK
jgi:hypothetical protein